MFLCSVYNIPKVCCHAEFSRIVPEMMPHMGRFHFLKPGPLEITVFFRKMEGHVHVVIEQRSKEPARANSELDLRTQEEGEEWHDDRNVLEVEGQIQYNPVLLVHKDVMMDVPPKVLTVAFPLFLRPGLIRIKIQFLMQDEPMLKVLQKRPHNTETNCKAWYKDTEKIDPVL